uniref:Uncharacterized protein n=1 Tax=Cacopsylla melanoneura TaxID=428564 RepID=A0A8D9BVA8_9HEMI
MTMERIIFTEEKNGQNMLETCQNMHKICKKKMANILCTKHAKTMFYYVVYEKSSKYERNMHYMPKMQKHASHKKPLKIAYANMQTRKIRSLIISRTRIYSVLLIFIFSISLTVEPEFEKEKWI